MLLQVRKTVFIAVRNRILKEPASSSSTRSSYACEKIGWT